jgi:hypothetical protein
MKKTINLEHTPLKNIDYVSDVVIRTIGKIHSEEYSKLVLYGFCDNMKWLYRLLQEDGIKPILCDWREKYIDYDCGGAQLSHVSTLKDDENTLLVICLEEIQSLKQAMRYLFENDLNNIRVIYDRLDLHSPFHQEEPYKGINERARDRAVSMITDAQLFDLIQFIRLTNNVDGDVVEFGSLYGGSGAIIVEAVKHYGEKPVWLFDSFDGIPKSKYGLDHHWNGSFSDNSYKEVKDAFADCNNVKVIKGNICETYKQVTNNISFGYLASDTLESGELLLNFMWPKLSKGGIIAICDYGSYPNAIPLTMYTDKFLEDKDDAFIFHAGVMGIFIIKK